LFVVQAFAISVVRFVLSYFLATHTKNPGDTCENLIIIWKSERLPKWSIEFVKKTGRLVATIEEAEESLLKLRE